MKGVSINVHFLAIRSVALKLLAAGLWANVDSGQTNGPVCDKPCRPVWAAKCSISFVRHHLYTGYGHSPLEYFFLHLGY